ncbi:MAG: MarR family transcriptional regulator [Ignavibacteria bacterium]
MKLEEEIQQDHFINGYHKAVVNIIYTNNWIVQKQSGICKPYGITEQQYNILRILRGQHPKPATIKLLVERMLNKMSDASRLVEKLRLTGLAERCICPDNRRSADVSITEKGLDILSKIDKLQDEVQTYMLNLNEQEINQLNTLLDKLRG